MAERRAAVLCFSGTSYKRHPISWAKYLLGRWVWASVSLIFIPALPSGAGGEFWSLLSFNGTCHASWELLNGIANSIIIYYNEGIMSREEICPFFHFSWSASRAFTQKCVVSCQSGGSCFSLSAHGHGRCCLHDAWFLAICAPRSPRPPVRLCSNLTTYTRTPPSGNLFLQLHHDTPSNIKRNSQAHSSFPL